MKNLIKKLLRESINEIISASDAYNCYDSIMTIVNNRRNVGFVVMLRPDEIKLIKDNGIHAMKVPSNPNNAYIIYNDNGKQDALELLDIAEKYDGYLAHNATEAESRRIGQLLGYKESDIDEYIEHVRKMSSVDEQMIDGQNMNQGTQTACNTMSVATYAEGLKLIVNAIGKPSENPKMWARIAKPLSNWKQANISINNQKHTEANGSYASNTNGGMTGDSMPDESNTWWSAIQTTICEQGGDGLY